jgi:two-component system, chemotaxis family, sensor kinase CheA
MAILVDFNNQQIALLADEILGQQQVVIKSLATHYKRVEGLQGATILGDGRVALVADLAGLLRLQQRGAACLEPERGR